MQMSPEGRKALTEAFEGFRANAYRDCVGVATIGYGHTAAAGLPIPRLGMVITQAQADQILSDDLAKTEAGVAAAVHVKLTQGQFDALADAAFNFGLGNFRSSSFLRKLNAGDYRGCADGLLAWDRAGGKVVAGLTCRRQAERAWFIGLAKGEPFWPTPELGTMPHLVDRADHPVVQIYNRARLAVRGSSTVNAG